MNTVYYIGGHWDLHKVATPKDQKLETNFTVRVYKPSESKTGISPVDHQYILRQVGKDVYVAVYSEIAV